MKKFSNLILLLPCHSLEDFPVHGSKHCAKNLLAAWTGVWHPELISGSGKAPIWRSNTDTVSSEQEAELHRQNHIQPHYYDDDGTANFDDQENFEFDPDTFEAQWRDCLVVIPDAAKAKVFDGFESKASESGATIVTDFDSRQELLARIGVESKIDPDLIDDFFALAYVRLQVEMMTQKLRYSSNLDCERFGKTVVAAAVAAKKGDSESVKSGLQAAFDQLLEEKNQYYAVAADFVDMVLVNEKVRPESVASELESESPRSFVMSGAAIEHFARQSPETNAKIAARIEDGSASIICGPQYELPDNLLSVDTMLNQLKLGRATCEDKLGADPEVYMRRRFGLNASLPGVLECLGFKGAIHATLDQGSIPKCFSNGMRWMGVDGGTIMAIGETPLDAACDKSFLDLGVRIGTELDSAHVSSVFFARWPTQTCDSLNDLRNATRYGSVLGDFTDAESYFEDTYDPGYGDAFEADEYEPAWFKQSVGSGSKRPISTFTNYWKNWYHLAAVRNLLAIRSLQGKGESFVDVQQQLASIQNRIELQTVDWDTAADDSITGELDSISKTLLSEFSGELVNTVPWRQRSHIELEPGENQSGAFKGDGAIKHASRNSDRCDAIVELSGFGQLNSKIVDCFGSSKAVKEPAVDDGESILRNEFFEVRMDRTSGGIRGVHFYGKRGTLLSQRLAVRSVDASSKEVVYSKMICDSFVVKTLSTIASQITSSGSLVGADGETLAKFVQTVGLQRGRSLIEIDIELTEVTTLDGSVGNYIANRIAWSEESAELFCDIQGGRHAVRRPKIEAPHYVEIVQTENRFALLTKGLPWHRRSSKKMLDSILVAGQETQTRFSLGIAINQESTMQLAVAEMHPVLSADGEGVSCETNSEDESSWLLHLANRNIVASGCRPIFDDDCRCVGMRVRLRETDGRAGSLKLFCRREIESIQLESLDDQPVRDIAIDQEKRNEAGYWIVETSFAAYEYFQLKLCFSQSPVSDGR